MTTILIAILALLAMAAVFGALLGFASEKFKVDGDPIVDADNENVKAWAGLREDPFFFDLTGYQETLDTGTIAFDSNRDDFAGTNVTAIVIEMDAAAAAADGTQLQIWATTGRL